MKHAAEVVSATEAAAVAGLSLRDVHRVIDEEIVPSDFIRPEGRRTLLASVLPLITFYFGTADRLTANERHGVIIKLAKRLRAANRVDWRGWDVWAVTDDYLTVDAGPFVRRAEEGLERLAAAREIVVSSPEILSGMLVVKGTRVPVYDVAASLAAGCSVEEVQEDYPSLTTEQVELCGLYAKANPPRGRPRRTRLPKGDRLITDRKVSRRAL